MKKTKLATENKAYAEEVATARKEYYEAVETALKKYYKVIETARNERFHSNSNPEKGKVNFEQGITGTGI
jgi:vacuolar-type H+-ATPase subunit D/Vma8